MEITGEEDHTGSGLTISKNGVKKIYISYSEKLKIEINGDRW